VPAGAQWAPIGQIAPTCGKDLVLSVVKKKIEIGMNLSIIEAMYEFRERSLAIVLVLLLGLSPLHSALAAAVWSQAQGQPMADCMHASDMVMADGQSAQDREPCCIGQDCAGHACFSGQCASVGMAILPTFSYVLAPTVMANGNLVKNGFESHYPPSLLRPPIA